MFTCGRRNREKFKAKVLNEICKHRDFSWFNFFGGILYIRIVDACIMDGCDVQTTWQQRENFAYLDAKGL